MPCHGNTVFQAQAFDWDERDNVGRSQPRVGTLVMVQVNEFRRFAHATNCRFGHSFSIADNRDDTPVVVGIHLAVEQEYAVPLHGVHNGVDFRRVAAFGEIRDALNQGLHTREE